MMFDLQYADVYLRGPRVRQTTWGKPARPVLSQWHLWYQADRGQRVQETDIIRDNKEIEGGSGGAW